MCALYCQGLRAQIDRDKYRQNMQECMKRIDGLHLLQDSVEDLSIHKKGEDPHCLQVDGICLGM